MEVTIEQLLQFYGESQVNLRLLEQEIKRLLQENEKLRGEGQASPPAATQGDKCVLEKP